MSLRISDIRWPSDEVTALVERYNVSTVVLASDNQHAVDACQAKPYRCVALAMDRAAEGMGRGRRSLLTGRGLHSSTSHLNLSRDCH